MIPARIQELLDKHRQGELQSAEQLELYRWYNQRAEDQVEIDRHEMEQRLLRISDQLPLQTSKKQISFAKYAWAAAAALVLLGLSITLNPYRSSQTSKTFIVTVDSSASAEFITADNKSIALNTLNPLDSIRTADLLLYRTQEGYIAYEYQGEQQLHDRMHTVRTPIGTEVKLLLPDGTKVWLNAGSELSFPLLMKSEQRNVYLKGEAYFDVNRLQASKGNANRFIVHSEGQRVEVLGTKFNIKNFAEDPITQTSLFEGSIKLQTLDASHKVNQSVLLAAGQQGIFNRESELLDFKNISEESPQTWRDGYFSFHGESLPQVCQQLARWYPVTFELQENLPLGQYYGDIPKSYSLNEVLNILIQEKLEYSIRNENQKIRITLTKKQ